MKIIFLDIDGVLNTSEYMGSIQGSEEEMKAIDPQAVKILNDLITDTGAKVVITSTWRRFVPFTEICYTLENKGLTNINSIIGMTRYLLPRKMSMPSTPRGKEIQEWINGFGSENITKFVIIDDDSDMVHLMPNLIKINNKVGLTVQNADRAREKLK